MNWIQREWQEDWFKLLFRHPEPVWSGDVTSNRAVEGMKSAGICYELEDGWHLTERAVLQVRRGEFRARE